MLRTRLASLILAAGLLPTTGCFFWDCHHPFARRHAGHCAPCDPCSCETAAFSPGFEGPALVPSDGLFTQPPPAMPLQPPPPYKGAPPRVVPIPQATPTPYTP